ncbi:uncharacterized protein LOC117318493, partial [Pecten maximus]|uniref:uncharacterized protein LOC117318493 n=1 Tax=Pecten maximus TaxID=6579 RepID=UPI001458CBAB
GSAPLLSCPNTSVLYINTSTGYSINPLSDIPGFTLPTLPGVIYTADPPFVTVNFASLNTLQKVTVKASYRNLLSSYCSFLVATEASGCLIDSLQPVENSGKSCTANTYLCSLPCIVDYVHYNTGLNTKNYNCTGANIWSPPLSREPCIKPMTSQYTITINATFELQHAASGCMEAFVFSAHPSLIQALLGLVCQQTSLSISSTIDSTVTDTNSISSIMTVTLDPNTIGAFKTLCSNSIDANIKTDVISPLLKVSSPIICSAGTSTVVPILTKSGVLRAGNACLQAGYVLRQKDSDEEC